VGNRKQKTKSYEPKSLASEPCGYWKQRARRCGRQGGRNVTAPLLPPATTRRQLGADGVGDVQAEWESIVVPPGALAGFLITRYLCCLSVLIYAFCSPPLSQVSWLRELRHGSGSPAAHVYGWQGAGAGGRAEAPGQGPGGQGPVVAFNLRRPSGKWVGCREVERMAALEGIRLRTGCFCNPGLWPSKSQLQLELFCMEPTSLGLLNPTPLPSVRPPAPCCICYLIPLCLL